MRRYSHPAKFSGPILPVLARYADGARSILDPFAGTGKVVEIRNHLSTQPGMIFCNEIEPDWAVGPDTDDDGEIDHALQYSDQACCGDARQVSKRLGKWGVPQHFDAIVTSPAYGNRMADSCDWAEGRKHSTYTGALRKTVGDKWATLQPGNSGAMQWGDDYRRLHREAWAEMVRVLSPGGRLVLNIADHYRNGELQRVPEWHVSVLLALGFRLLDWVEVGTVRYGFGANSEKRSPELVICLELMGESGIPWRWKTALIGGTDGLWTVDPEPQQISLFEEVTA